MTPGKNYRVHCPDWYTYVGRLVRQATPLLWEFEMVSKIRNTNNGDCWEKLDDNTGDRSACDYRHYNTPVFLPVTIAAFEWVGELPWKDEGDHG